MNNHEAPRAKKNALSKPSKIIAVAALLVASSCAKDKPSSSMDDVRPHITPVTTPETVPEATPTTIVKKSRPIDTTTTTSVPEVARTLDAYATPQEVEEDVMSLVALVDTIGYSQEGVTFIPSGDQDGNITHTFKKEISEGEYPVEMSISVVYGGPVRNDSSLGASIEALSLSQQSPNDPFNFELRTTTYARINGGADWMVMFGNSVDGTIGQMTTEPTIERVADNQLTLEFAANAWYFSSHMIGDFISQQPSETDVATPELPVTTLDGVNLPTTG